MMLSLQLHCTSRESQSSAAETPSPLAQMIFSPGERSRGEVRLDFSVGKRAETATAAAAANPSATTTAARDKVQNVKRQYVISLLLLLPEVTRQPSDQE